MQRYAYDSFGNMRHHGDEIRQPYAYTGREWDEEIKLYYYRARYYDARAGRFISEDPVGLDGGTINLYEYVGNNPVNRTDPSGEIAPAVVGAWAGLVAVGAGLVEFFDWAINPNSTGNAPKAGSRPIQPKPGPPPEPPKGNMPWQPLPPTCR